MLAAAQHALGPLSFLSFGSYTVLPFVGPGSLAKESPRNRRSAGRHALWHNARSLIRYFSLQMCARAFRCMCSSPDRLFGRRRAILSMADSGFPPSNSFPLLLPPLPRKRRTPRGANGTPCERRSSPSYDVSAGLCPHPLRATLERLSSAFLRPHSLRLSSRLCCSLVGARGPSTSPRGSTT